MEAEVKNTDPKTTPESINHNLERAFWEWAMRTRELHPEIDTNQAKLREREKWLIGRRVAISA